MPVCLGPNDDSRIRQFHKKDQRTAPPPPPPPDPDAVRKRPTFKADLCTTVYVDHPSQASRFGTASHNLLRNCLFEMTAILPWCRLPWRAAIQTQRVWSLTVGQPSSDLGRCRTQNNAVECRTGMVCWCWRREAVRCHWCLRGKEKERTRIWSENWQIGIHFYRHFDSSTIAIIGCADAIPDFVEFHSPLGQ